MKKMCRTIALCVCASSNPETNARDNILCERYSIKCNKIWISSCVRVRLYRKCLSRGLRVLFLYPYLHGAEVASFQAGLVVFSDTLMEFPNWVLVFLHRTPMRTRLQFVWIHITKFLRLSKTGNWWDSEEYHSGRILLCLWSIWRRSVGENCWLQKRPMKYMHMCMNPSSFLISAFFMGRAKSPVVHSIDAFSSGWRASMW